MTKMMKELMQYINLLRDLLKEGFKCERELQEALQVLHKEMLPIIKANNENKFVLVLESDFNGVIKSLETFKALMGNPQIARKRSGDDHDLRVGNIRVMVAKVDTNKDKFRGYSPDYIINNTDANLESLGLRTK